MRLICESAGQCNVREPLPGGCHHEFGALDSAYCDIRHGGGPNGLIERSQEMTLAQGDQVRHVSNCQLGAEIRLDVGYSPFRLPNREAAGSKSAMHRGRIDVRFFCLRAKERRRIPQAAPRCLPIGIKECHGSPHEIPNARRC